MTATTTTQLASRRGAARWAFLLRPRWIAWHSIIVLASIGMFFLGDWQLHRAESGNELSWAYTFEWPSFAAFTLYFWIKSVRDEFREQGAAASAAATSGAAAAVTAPDPDAAATAAPAAHASAAAEFAAEAAPDGRRAGAASGSRPDSWDATSWDATSWEATGATGSAGGDGTPVDVAHATPADGAAYVARLMAEVQRPGRGRGRG